MAAKFAKHIIPHMAITNTLTHTSIIHHIDNGNAHNILNISKNNSREWNIKEALNHPEGWA